jgi:NDP-sugar pyrophosphorylase family protein
MIPAIILAGGLATRLRPVTEKIPKALVEINGRPFVAHQLELLARQGIREVIFCLGYLGEQVVDYVGTGSKFGVKVQYVFDGPVLLGTAGCIRQALPLLPHNFFVLYGDSYLPCDYQAVQAAFFAQQRLGLMTVFHNQGQWDTSNVEFSLGKILRYDKIARTAAMHYIDYGLGVFTREVFLELPTEGPYDLAQVYQKLLMQDQLAALEIKERFYEVGSFQGIKELSEFLT